MMRYHTLVHLRAASPKYTVKLQKKKPSFLCENKVGVPVRARNYLSSPGTHKTTVVCMKSSTILPWK